MENTAVREHKQLLKKRKAMGRKKHKSSLDLKGPLNEGGADSCAHMQLCFFFVKSSWNQD